jgi:hypothetical protein
VTAWRQDGTLAAIPINTDTGDAASMKPTSVPHVPALPFRQVHLDFHTSEAIAGVGSKFSKEQFQEELKRGHVNSVTVFSKCHHGMSYHDTSVGVRHPGMDEELLPLQLEACAEIGVQAPVYLSAGLDEAMATAHPEWCLQSKDGKLFAPLNAGWKGLSFSSPYLDYLCDQIEEVVRRFKPIGIFFDIIHPHRDYSVWALRDMRSLGLDPNNDADADEYSMRVLNRYFERTTAACRVVDENIRVFHNSGHIAKGNHKAMAWNTHLELESLPTGGWGYDHFPLSAKYAATTGYDFLGMTGKFHTTWGEFGGFKRKAALRYECAAMLAFGSKCSVGDQLHPNGEMNPDTYDLIGAAYKEVEEKEAWCEGAIPVSEIAVVSPEALHIGILGEYRNKGAAEEGASRMLLELHESFDVVDLDADFSRYKVLVLPDEITLENPSLREKLSKYLQEGGKVLASGRSGMAQGEEGFVLDFGLEHAGQSHWNPDYLVPTALSPTPEVRGPFVIHKGAQDVSPRQGTQVLAGRAVPYFNRAWDHFCSHQHTPDARPSEFPGATLTRNVAYFAHPIFTCYRELGQPLYRDLVQDALRALRGAPSVETNLPTTGRVSLMKQGEQNRYVLHLLHAVPVKRGADHSEWASSKWSVEVIEDLHPVHGVEVQLRVPEEVKSARLVPQGRELELRREDGAVSFNLDKLECHAMIELAL